jgi:elongation factor Ts
MTNMNLVRELREITNAGMKDCVEALKDSNGDLQSAVDLIKIRGKNITSALSSRATTEGIICSAFSSVENRRVTVMVEVNCQTDFVARNPSFQSFVKQVTNSYLDSVVGDQDFASEQLESARQDLVSSTKENIVIGKKWSLEALSKTSKVFSYVHNNSKIGVLLLMQASSEELLNSREFNSLGSDLTMQICAMSPIAIQQDRISLEDLERQKKIFQAQLQEENKPPTMWDKIMVGKLVKWYKEICLLEQESLIVFKTPIKKVISDLEAKLIGKITIVDFVRAEVG